MKQAILTPQDKDFPRWYQDVITKAELAENGPVRGTMVIRPYAYRIWELLQAELDRRIKAAGAENAYFPLFIPEEFLKREAEHVEGFSPELAVVTRAGGKQLEEPVVVRPTSETIINHYFSKWVQSHRDLPLLINQWGNAVRWEMRPRLFLRTTEFLWQEGHTAHATEQDAHQYALNIFHNVYADTMIHIIGVPILRGRKTDDERFAGATITWTCEGMMRDGKALQMGTSHELGQNFAKAFNTQYVNVEGERDYVWQSSWGVSTRAVGGLIMVHGDDNGLRLPPALAPYQVVILLVRDDNGAGERAAQLADQLSASGHRVHFDNRTDVSFGRRATNWELKGAPLRVEVGPRELAEDRVTVVRRDTSEKQPVAINALGSHIKNTLVDIQRNLLAEATKRRDENTAEVKTVAEAAEAALTGFARIPWATIRGEGVEVLHKTSVTVRCLQRADGSLPDSPDDSDLVATVGRAY